MAVSIHLNDGWMVNDDVEWLITKKLLYHFVLPTPFEIVFIYSFLCVIAIIK